MMQVLEELTSGSACWPVDALRHAKRALQEIAKLRQCEATHCVRRGAASEEAVAAFQQWLTAHAASPLHVRVQNVGDQGHGLVATKPLSQEEPFISIPYGMILSSDASVGPPADCKRWDQVARDPLLSRFPTALLTLHVLAEACDSDTKKPSFFKAYIDVLPPRFDIALFYDETDLDAIEGTPLFEPAVKLLYNSIKQFLYLQQLRCKLWSRCPIPEEKFTLTNYFWALGAVLTRQNEVAVDKHGKAVMALIPGWDMCNHEPGSEITTFADPVQRVVVCHAKRGFQLNEQVTMFYGPRSNVQLLTYSGFVVDMNPYDRISMSLALDSSDPLLKIRRMIVQKEASHDPTVSADGDGFSIMVSGDGCLVSFASLRALQVSNMTKESLTKALRSDAFGQDRAYEWTPEELAATKAAFAAMCDAAQELYHAYAMKVTKAAHGVLFERFFKTQASAIHAAKANDAIFA